MKRSLLLLGVIAALAIGAPAYSQYIFMDVNGDGVCTSTDLLSSSTTAVDIWLNTNHNKDGTTVTCDSNPTQPLDMFSYSLLFRSQGTGSLTYNGWTNAPAGYTATTPFTVAGTDAGTDYNGPTGANLGPGLVKLGTLGVTVTGSPRLIFLQDNVGSPGLNTAVTGFGTSCDATTYPNTYSLGIDFFDNCGTSSNTPTEATTWGKIKQLYK